MHDHSRWPGMLIYCDSIGKKRDKPIHTVETDPNIAFYQVCSEWLSVPVVLPDLSFGRMKKKCTLSS